MLIVSQRVSTVRTADIILVLNNGLLDGCGTHEELYTRSQVYRDICLSQQTEEVAK